STDLDGMTISVGARGDNARAETGLTLNLINNSNGISGKTINLPDVFMKGHSLRYEIELLDDDGNVIARNNGSDLSTSAAIDSDGNFSTTGFHARVGNKLGLDPGTEDLIVDVDPVRPAKDIINNNNDTWKPPEEEFREIQEQDEEISNEMKIFAGVNGSTLRTKLSDGGHVNSKTIGFGLGGTKTLVSKQNGSHFSFAPIIDHGKGKFDTYTANGEHGDGDTHFSAGGFIARRMLNNGFYYEGSLRYGRAKSSFSSNDFAADANDETYASYDMSAPIIAGHVHIGKLFAINRENTVHVYGQYLHAHQGSMAADLSSGEHYVFDSVNDGTFIAGIRFINQPNRVNKFYSGFAYQYEHSSGSSATYDGQSTREVDSNGGSGMFELGWELKPHDAIPWVIDLGAIGWIGQQKGLTFHAKVKKSF
ncbi:MAG: autotransporter outer membrane beta-barrel domain-containing protein, partial [Selenomonadaceae bacterium]|nr:autotransporter outer membrane beta-barrel domain-containing protein [Selenomonadaceae bacterium]